MTGASALRVLVVHTERDTLMTLSIMLRSEGIDVRLAARGAEVHAAVSEFRPDVVLMDVGLPDVSGLQVALDLTRHRGANCPVLIALTQNTSDVAQRLMAKSGFQHHVSRPYDPDAVIRLVTSVGRSS